VNFGEIEEKFLKRILTPVLTCRFMTRISNNAEGESIHTRGGCPADGTAQVCAPWDTV